MGISLKPTLHYKNEGVQPSDSLTIFILHAHNSWSLYNRLTQNLGFKLQNLPWGDPMSNRPPPQTLWLALESLCWCGDIRVETSQLGLDAYKVGIALSTCLFNLLYSLFRNCGVKIAPLHLFLRPLHLRELVFNFCCDYDGLINPRLNTCLQNYFFLSCCVHCLFKRFGL